MSRHGNGRKKRFTEEDETQNGQHEYERTEQNIKIGVQAKTAGQKEYIKEIIRNDITICQGLAGTGKSYIAIGMALQAILAKDSKMKKIILLRSVKEACNESVGFLAGDLEAKMSVWIAPIVDNLSLFINKRMIDNLIKSGTIEAIPLAFLRGRSLNNAFIILDETQNCSREQLLMSLTRIGENSKMVIIGDITQNDHLNNARTGLEDCIDRLNGMDGVGIIQLDETDIVRNRLIGEIIRRYSN